jgi:hypothetical protein
MVSVWKAVGAAGQLQTNPHLPELMNQGGPRLVLVISYLQKIVYLCEICGSGYADQATANSCENYCRTHKNCSPQMTKKAVLRPQ